MELQSRSEQLSTKNQQQCLRTLYTLRNHTQPTELRVEIKLNEKNLKFHGIKSTDKIGPHHRTIITPKNSVMAAVTASGFLPGISFGCTASIVNGGKSREKCQLCQF
jgi:hypothetical protein